MQLYAYDLLQKLVPASRALKGQDYLCPECRNPVRRRGGLHRQDHFYHLESNLACRQSGKSAEHLQVQNFLLQALSSGGGLEKCFLEHPFPSIGRIADFFWENEKIVFEVQCSPISQAEVQARNRDYRSLGICPVWILHDARYRKRNLSPAEAALTGEPHYFTNIDKDGLGEIYDFFSILHRGKRLHALSPLPIDVRQVHRSLSLSIDIPWSHLERRFKAWGLYFAGDLGDSFLKGDLAGYCAAAEAVEREFMAPFAKSAGLAVFLQNCAAPFRALFQLILERSCR